MKFNICPDCGAHLDFGEVCDCSHEKENDEQKGGETFGGDIETAGGAIPRRRDRAARVS